MPLPRIPLFRAGFPYRISRPLLPLTSRFTSPAAFPTLTNAPRRALRSQSRFFHHFPARLTTPTYTSPPPNAEQPDPKAPLSQRLRFLIKTYGWYALGIYAILTVLDFGVAFAGVNFLGAEYASRLAASVKAYVASLLHYGPSEQGREEVEQAQVASGTDGGHEGLYAMLVLAYTIHKTIFMPVRIGLTAAITPKFVNWLRSRGWAGGAGTMRAAREMRERVRRGRD